MLGPGLALELPRNSDVVSVPEMPPDLKEHLNKGKPGIAAEQ